MSNVVKIEINGEPKYLELETDVLDVLTSACDDTIKMLIEKRKDAFELARQANSNSSKYVKLKRFTKICDSYMDNKKLKEDLKNPITNAYIF